MTSNHNEAIHSILFQMIIKTEAVGMDTMKLGAGLAVIRYIDGCVGVSDRVICLQDSFSLIKEGF